MQLHPCFSVAKPYPYINKAVFLVVPKAFSLQKGWFSLQTLQQSYRSLLLLEKSEIYLANLSIPHADGNPA